MIQYIIQFVFGALIGLAAFYILEDIFKIPLSKTIRSVRGLADQMKDGETKINDSLEMVATWISKILRINDYKRAQMEADLRTARINLTPEMFMANAIVKAGVVGVFALPALLVWPLLAGLIAFAAVLMYVNEMKSLPGRLKAKRAAIEYELPRFVFTIEKTLRHSRDVLTIIESFSEICGPEMKYELEITAADMRTGNYQTAISRLEERIGSPLMSDVCRGLISVMRGDDTEVYWKSLELKLSAHQREMLKIESEKIPAKVRRLSVVMLICFLAIWVVVIAVQVIESLAGMFG